MSLLFIRRAIICFCWSFFLAIPAVVFGQTTNYYSANGTEYPIIGSLSGDQMFPDAALNSSGGYIVWQDNVTDGNGWGISMMPVNGTLSGSGSVYRVNQQGAGDQENPRVALLKNGGAAFVWQGGVEGFQHIYASFFNASNVLVNPANTNDILVNTMATNIFYNYITNTTTVITTNQSRHSVTYVTNTTMTISEIAITNSSGANFQINPAIATLNNGNVIVVWAGFNQAGSNSLQDVYGQILSPSGDPIGDNFLINQFTSYNQRNPSVAALKNGGFVVVWVSEQQRTVAVPNGNPTTTSQMAYPSVDIYARIYDADGNATGGEFLVNADSNPCANPDVAAGSDGGFMVTWDARDMANQTNSLDIYARVFSGADGGAVLRVNSYLYGDQYAPRISSIGTDYLVVWTSLAQDGSRQGVYGQSIYGNGSASGGEFRVNTTTVSQQIQPMVASDDAGKFLVIWSSFSGAPNSFDLFAQRYASNEQILPALPAPFVYAPFELSNGVYRPELEVSWPPVSGLAISNYEVYVDGATMPTVMTTGNVWTMTAADGLANNSAHSFAVDYVTTDGRRSPISQSTANSTWSGSNWGGIPFEWMEQFYGSDGTKWPSPNAALAAGGLTLAQVFQSGGNPLDSSTWLQTTLVNTSQGLFLSWNPQPGFTYQVQVTTNLTTWSNLGAPRFAAGDSDSIFVGKGSAGYYRVVLLRQ